MNFKHSASILTLLATGALPGVAAQAQQASAPNTSASNVNVLNLLAPYLNLNATTIGQATLSTNLSQAIAVNNGTSPATQALGESDENLLGNISNTLRTAPAGGTTATTFGIAANLGGGLPNQAAPAGGTVVPMQAVGGLGVVLGNAYVNGVAPSGGTLTAVETLLNTAYNGFTSRDLGVAKAYFSDGSFANTMVNAAGATVNATSAATATQAVAPPGFTLPIANGLPNPVNSVYDIAAGVTNQQAGQDIYGSSRPDQVSTKINSFDPTALNGISTNPSFPSGHTTYAYTDSLLLALLVPQEYQSMLYRASAYANSRIVVGVHYPLDIIGSRALAQYDLAQAFTNPAYQNGAATTVPGATANVVNLPTLFKAASAQITPSLTTASVAAGCGSTIAACAASAANTANDPYVVNAANAATYTSNLTYGLPTLTLAQAPREGAPAGGPDASVLLAPIFGGSTAVAAALAPNGGIAGTLSTGTINQIIVNTETNALAAFYGTSLSYWTRIDLAAAAGYFGNVIGTTSLATTDVVNVPVTVGAGGVLDANGTLNGATTVTTTGALTGSGRVNGTVTVSGGGTLAPGSLAAQTALLGNATAVPGTRLTVAGNVALTPGSTLAIFASPTQATSLAATGTASVAGATLAVQAPANAAFAPFTAYTVVTANGGVTGTFAGATTNLPFLTASLSYDPNDVILALNRNTAAFLGAAGTTNQLAVAQGLSQASAGPTGSAGGAILNAAFGQLSGAQARATFDALSGEGIVAAQNVAHRSASEFTSTIFDQTTFFGPGQPTANSITLTNAPGLQARAPDGAVSPVRELADLPTHAMAPVTPIPVTRTWRAWATGFGGAENFGGNPVVGSAAFNDQIYGGTLGVDYQVTPNALVGVAVGGSNGTFNAGARATSGSTTGGHVALYDFVTLGRFYGAASVGGSFFDNKTTRNVAGFGGLNGETDIGRFGSQEVRTRVEGGRPIPAFGNGVLTPFVAVEAASLRSDGFSESNRTGPTALGLTVQGQSSASVPGFLGARYQGTAGLGNGLVLVPSVQAAYVHEFAPQRSQVASLIDLPAATFLVDGARPSYNAAQVKAGAELAVGPHSVLFASFDGEFSGQNQFYGGHGGFRYTW